MEDGLSPIIEAVREHWVAKNAARELALQGSRELIRYCATSIRATHRGEFDQAETLLASAREAAAELGESVAQYPDLAYAGYTRDALKELSEAHIVFALIAGHDVPTPESLGVGDDSYMKGLGEAMGEMRRYSLDLIRRGEIKRAERFLQIMDDVYSALMTLDFPDALTGGLRRTSDMVRGVVERTRGDLTTAVRQEELQESLQEMEAQLRSNLDDSHDDGV